MPTGQIDEFRGLTEIFTLFARENNHLLSNGYDISMLKNKDNPLSTFLCICVNHGKDLFTRLVSSGR